MLYFFVCYAATFATYHTVDTLICYSHEILCVLLLPFYTKSPLIEYHHN